MLLTISDLNLGDAIPIGWVRVARTVEGSRFICGSGGGAVFAESCLGVRNCSQPFATVRNRLRECRNRLHECDKLSTVASASGVVRKACEVDPLPSQLYWCLQRKCVSVSE